MSNTTVKELTIALVNSLAEDEKEIVVVYKGKDYKVKDCYTDITGVFRLIVKDKRNHHPLGFPGGMGYIRNPNETLQGEL